MLTLAVSMQQASAQASSGWFSWFSFLQADWIDWYVADDNSDEGILLTEVPDEFGDSFARGGRLTITSLITPDLLSSSDVVLAGGSRGLKVGEHNKAIPMNRVYLTYNHFHNAVAAAHEEPRGNPVAAGSANIDRYMFGVESRFGCGLWSAELRMPFTAGYDFAAPANSVTYAAGEVGNLSLILKRLVYYDRCTSVVAGLGIETPTGSDFSANVLSTPAVRYRVANDAVHLHPYVGILRSPSERFFWHSFLQLDLAANGNRLIVTDQMAAARAVDLWMQICSMST